MDRSDKMWVGLDKKNDRLALMYSMEKMRADAAELKIKDIEKEAAELAERREH